MALREFFRTRLALRIYLVGLAQFAVVAAGFAAIVEANRPTFPGPHEGQAHFIAGSIAAVIGDPAATQRELDRAKEELRVTMTVIDPDEAVLASTAPPGAPRCSREATPRPRGACRVEPLRFPNGKLGRVEMLLPGPPRRPPPVGIPVIALVLVVVGVSSWLLARTLALPLKRLSASARAFGNGDLQARAALDRGDELGEVSRAFDEMADRVTDLLRAERELLANVSHELRTPLARIRVALDIAVEGDADAAHASIAEIAEDLDELERLIADILTAARLDLGDGSLGSGAPPLRRSRIDLHDLLAHAVARFRAAHPGRALEIEEAASLPALSGDPVLLRRVIDNLLENAFKYAERADAPITLAARAEASVIIEVRDRGIGIAAADLPRLFRPFFRADKSRTRATGGLGLGLALAKRIVDAHGGTITIESKPNEGTVARVTLPFDDKTAQ